jgi:hypothetical protein
VKRLAGVYSLPDVSREIVSLARRHKRLLEQREVTHVCDRAFGSRVNLAREVASVNANA